MRENGEKERTELDMLLERYDALVSEARGLEEQVKLRLLAGRKAKLGLRNGRLAPDVLEARLLLITASISHEEAARGIGMARGTMSKKMNGFTALYPEEIARLRELAGKAGRA